MYQPKKPGAPLLMFYADGFNNVGKSYVKTSTDEGETWSDRYEFPSDVYDDIHSTWPAAPLEISPDANNAGYPTHTLLKSADKEFNGGMYIIPGNNYTGVEPGGDPWGINMFRTWEFTQTDCDDPPHERYCGMVYSFLVPNPNNWGEIAAIVRKYDQGDRFYIARSHDGGNTWDPGLSRIDVENDKALQNGGFGLSVDLYGGPLQQYGWQLAAGAHGGRGYIIVAGTQDLNATEWQILVELDIGPPPGLNADPADPEAA
ncbi:MAG: hypothetical protein GF401_20275 [Chitinivibrionales bacterium]|nr:hypothetical protein [Chitinivibrionales bacterium]